MIGAEIKNNTKQGDLIIANQHLLKPHLFYYGQRKGWGTTHDKKLSSATLNEYVAKGARLYIMVEGNLEETDSELYEFLNSHHQFLKKDDKITLFKLLPGKQALLKSG